VYLIDMRVLELFSGTGSVGKVCALLGYEVVSVDMCDKYNKPTHLTDIMNWNYTMYPVGHFDFIWASPPCQLFSNLRSCWIGRTMKSHGDTIITKEILLEDIEKKGLPIVRRMEEIIDYFNPPVYCIENPGTGRMKEYINKPMYTVDYCKYADWGYKKPTTIWTNKIGFVPKRCKNDCNSIETICGKKSHKIGIGMKTYVKDGENYVRVNNAEKRYTYKDTKKVYESPTTKLSERYRVPPLLIQELLQH